MEKVEWIFISSEVMHLPEYGSYLSISMYLPCLLVINLETYARI